MDKLVEVSYDREVAVVRLARGITNAINPELVAGLRQAMAELRQDASVRGLVLASANDKFFSIGFDIPELYGFEKEEFATFFRAFSQACIELYAFPKPTAAAITGHATAGGCILALCCDRRFIAQGHKLVGLNEIKLGVPAPYVADCILRSRVGYQASQEILETGAFFEPDAAMRLGLVDEVLPIQEVIPRAVSKVGEIGGFPEGAFAAIKRNRTEAVIKKVEERLEARNQEFVSCWYSEEARERLEEASRKF